MKSTIVRFKRTVSILLGLAFLLALGLGIVLGLALAETRNYQVLEEMDVMQSALPTQIYDINNNLITEFFSDEKREIVSLDQVPEVLVNALVTREDQEFYYHNGVKPSSYLRAFIGYVSGNYSGGGSMLTMQVAGTRHANRREITIRRKLKETWYAIQMERRYTKNEILEFYMNEMPFGGGTNGVEAASKYYFNKSVRDISLAEAVILVLTLSAPDRYSPLKNPALVQERQRYILDEMVRFGYADREEADRTFQAYWDDYAWDRYATFGAFIYREDKAPWFSEYVRIQLEDLLLGSQDLYRGGMKVQRGGKVTVVEFNGEQIPGWNASDFIIGDTEPHHVPQVDDDASVFCIRALEHSQRLSDCFDQGSRHHLENDPGTVVRSFGAKCIECFNKLRHRVSVR